ncbi:MAG: hypothetical protein V1731_00260 [Candidatus Aenigmatarchaeota archaeon]
MSDFTVRDINLLERVLYHPSLDEIAKLGRTGWPKEVGGYMVGKINSKVASPEGFMESRNLSKSLEDAYTPSKNFAEISYGIGHVHTHPEPDSLPYPFMQARPSSEDIEYFMCNFIPFGLIAATFPSEIVYLKAWGAMHDANLAKTGRKELKISFKGRDFAGIIYNNGSKFFVQSDEEADERITALLKSRPGTRLL